TAIEKARKVELLLEQPANGGFAQAESGATPLEFLGWWELLHKLLVGAIHIFLRGLPEARRRCFLADDPLVGQLANDFLAGFRAAVHEFLEGREFAHFAFRDDVVLDPRGNPVDCLCCARRSGARRPKLLCLRDGSARAGREERRKYADNEGHTEH